MTAPVIEVMLDVLAQRVVPLTRIGVANGSKVFGAAIIDRTSYEVVIVGTNAETENPLFHGEISALNAYWATPIDERPPPEACLFVSSHEPCSLCLSAITWSGFDNFSYLFTYQDSRDAFAIPHDLKILDEVFGVADGGYRRSNAFWTAYSLTELIEELPDAEAASLRSRVDDLRSAYAELSAAYQGQKDDSAIPLK